MTRAARLSAAALTLALTWSCGGAPPPATPSAIADPAPPADAPAAADPASAEPAAEPAAADPTVAGPTDPNAEYACKDVGGECMEGCEQGWVAYDKLHQPCTDSICCVKALPRCAEDLGGTCMEGCEGGTSPVDEGTYRGCTDSVCCK